MPAESGKKLFVGPRFRRIRQQLGLSQTQIAEGLGITMAQLALAWVLREPNVASAIIGASRPQQVDDNAAASGIELDEATLDAIDEAVADVAVTDSATV